MTVLLVKLLSKNACLPVRSTPGSAGYDLYSAADLTIPPGGMGMIPLDIAIVLPPFTYGRISSRSGLASKYRLEVGAGVIDCDYRGELKVLLHNHGTHPYMVVRGMRIAQLIVQKIDAPDVIQVVDFDQAFDTERGSGGFGSTGIGHIGDRAGFHLERIIECGEPQTYPGAVITNFGRPLGKPL